jgi:hypothetical protein
MNPNIMRLLAAHWAQIALLTPLCVEEQFSFQ